MKKFLKFIGIATAISFVLAIIFSTFAYNTRPLPFEDQPVKANPVEEFIKDGAEKLGNATDNITLPEIPKIWEDSTTESPIAEQAPSGDLSNVLIGEPAYFNYDRSNFGAAWIDVDNNNCDTRNDILSRDLTNIAKEGHCKVTSGILEDAYTGETIEFIRGASKVDIDHVIPLSYASRQGAEAWTAEQREAFANDPANLEASSSSANRSKSDSGPADWMPTNAEYRCEYGQHFASVAVKYELPITQADYNAIVNACN